MFKYNELSDLLTGELVTPVQKDGDKIICIDKNLNKVYYSFSDFDFEKTVEERNFIVDDGSSDDSFDNSSESISSDDSSDDKEEEKIPVDKSDYHERWVTDNGEKLEILSAAGYKSKNINNTNIITFQII